MDKIKRVKLAHFLNTATTAKQAEKGEGQHGEQAELFFLICSNLCHEDSLLSV